MPDPVSVIPREGEIAFAVSVSTLYELTLGLVGWPVRFIRHSSPTEATLTLANLTPGGPVLNIMPPEWIFNPSLPPILSFTNQGIQQAQVGSYLDFLYQNDELAAPGTGTGLLRMYARNGALFFKAEDSIEQQIPIGDPPGPSMRYAYWLGGG